MKRRDFFKKLFIGTLALSNIRAIDLDHLLVKEKKSVYLTIDDGPRKTKSILNKLKNEDKVTFFMLGELLNDNYLNACAVLERGHIIGNHSYSHPEFSKISIDRAKREIEMTHKLIEKIYNDTGIKNPKLFRFPYFDPGFYMKKDSNILVGDPTKKKEISNFLKALGYKICECDIDTQDWRYYTRQRRLCDIIRDGENAKEGDVILVHELPISINYVIPAIEEKCVSKALS